MRRYSSYALLAFQWNSLRDPAAICDFAEVIFVATFIICCLSLIANDFGNILGQYKIKMSILSNYISLVIKMMLHCHLANIRLLCAYCLPSLNILEIFKMAVWDVHFILSNIFINIKLMPCN